MSTCLWLRAVASSTKSTVSVCPCVQLCQYKAPYQGQRQPGKRGLNICWTLSAVSTVEPHSYNQTALLHHAHYCIILQLWVLQNLQQNHFQIWHRTKRYIVYGSVWLVSVLQYYSLYSLYCKDSVVDLLRKTKGSRSTSF